MPFHFKEATIYQRKIIFMMELSHLSPVGHLDETLTKEKGVGIDNCLVIGNLMVIILHLQASVSICSLSFIHFDIS